MCWCVNRRLPSGGSGDAQGNVCQFPSLAVVSGQFWPVSVGNQITCHETLGVINPSPTHLTVCKRLFEQDFSTCKIAAFLCSKDFGPGSSNVSTICSKLSWGRSSHLSSTLSSRVYRRCFDAPLPRQRSRLESCTSPEINTCL